MHIFHVRADVRYGRGELNDVNACSPGLGVMRANPQPGLTSHSGHSRGPDKSAVVTQIRLDYIHHVVLNHPLEEPSTGILLTEGYFHIECVGNFFGVALLFPWTRL